MITIEFVLLFTLLACFVILAEGVSLIRKDIDDLKELIDKK